MNIQNLRVCQSSVMSCVALANPGQSRCPIHSAYPSYRPLLVKLAFKDWWERPKWPATPWDDEIDRRDRHGK